MNPAIKEGLKEGLRVAVIAAVFSILEAVSSGSLDVKLVAAGALIAVAKAVDKWLHKKTEEEGWLKKGGLTGF